MGFHRLRLAAVQAAPVFLSRDATVAKACSLIRDAGARGATILGFPEGFIPGHPLWYHFHPASGQKAFNFAKRLSENSVEIPSPSVAALCSAARDAGVFVVVGCCERLPGRAGTLFNTLLFITSSGELVGRHRKLIPTLGEQLVHTAGDTLGLRTYSVEQNASVSALICGENSNPLATFALDALGSSVHIAAWPPFFHVGADMMEIISIVSRSLAYQMKAYVINAVGAISEEMREVLPEDDGQRKFLEHQAGGASIIGPSGQVIAGPLEEQEGIVYADADLSERTIPKLIHDFGGHYNRFDLLRLELRSGNYSPIEFESAESLPGVAADLADGAQAIPGTRSQGALHRDQNDSAIGLGPSAAHN